MFILISLLIIGITVIEAPRLVKNKNWGELTAFTLLTLAGLVYSTGLALNLRFPNPNQIFKQVFSPITQYLEHLLT